MRAILLGLTLTLLHPAWALEFRSTARAAILYDAPSREASKLMVAGVGVPFEVLIETESWVKVRTAVGQLAWLEKAALANAASARTVLVTASEAVVRAQPQERAEAVFHAARGVVLGIDGAASNGWIKVNHPDGANGWLRQADVWGA